MSMGAASHSPERWSKKRLGQRDQRQEARVFDAEKKESKKTNLVNGLNHSRNELYERLQAFDLINIIQPSELGKQ